MTLATANGTRFGLIAATVALGLLAACSSDKNSNASGSSAGGGKAVLQRLQYGRLVDVYAYRRIDPSPARADRRDIFNRDIVPVISDIAIDPGIESESLFDAVGQENTGANYRFLPFDANVGHERLLILWDDTDATEKIRFDQALAQAQFGLIEVPASYRNQNTAARPIPVVPRNAALVLTFSSNLGLSSNFFRANPSAVQLLELRADPQMVSPAIAYRPVPNRVIAHGNQIIIDPTLIGGETQGGQFSAGMPPSLDNMTANIRIAVPTSGRVSQQFTISPDPVSSLNGVDMNGDPAVIRDFRSGNAKDGAVGLMPDNEPPLVVANVNMGITAVDTVNKILTLNKRSSQVAVRGRVPFVDGGIIAATGLPGGPDDRPTAVGLRSGDILMQDVQSPTGEMVRLRAEILTNEDVGNVVGDPTYPGLGLAIDGTDGGSAPTVRVRVASLTTKDSQGNPVSFQANTAASGADCTVRVHYYQNVPYTSGSATVSDQSRQNEFLVIDPPIPAGAASGTMVDPMSTVTMYFSEPIDLTSVDRYSNYVLTSDALRPGAAPVSALLNDPKAATLSLLAVDLIDQNRDGTALRLRPPLGLTHVNGQSEKYWCHLLIDDGNPDDPIADLGGNPIDIYDRGLVNRLDAFSVSLQLDPSAADNLVGSFIHRFAAADEDGTKPGSTDFFGQFQIADGVLSGAPVTRFSQIADRQLLATIMRWDKGECWDPTANMMTGANVPPSNGATSLYMCNTNVLFVQPAPSIPWMNQGVFYGGVVEPLNPRGSRLQMTYREDDFGLSYTDPSQMMLDVEQLNWAEWRNSQVQFDTFDRVTMRAGHCDWRPDLRYDLTPGQMTSTCDLRCESLFDGLRTTFAQNPLQGSTMTDLVKDVTYEVDPNSAFRSVTGTVFVPYPQFQRTYTWRDSRLVSWDMAANQPIGLAGAHVPNGVFPNVDQTTDVTSPWIPEELPPNFPGSIWDQSAGDFRGDQPRDHDPIALPLLLDFLVYPDGSQNGVASGANQMHIAYLGPCGIPGGYYNNATTACVTAGGGTGTALWPFLRVHTSGGVDGGGNAIFVNPETQVQASGGWILDPGLGDPTYGRYKAPAGDDHLPWAQADFVRKVSMVTFGFFDTLKPNQHDLDPTYANWPGASVPAGFPDLDAVASARQVILAPTDFLALIDPPPQTLPAGTALTVEFRGAETFTHDDTIYDKMAEDRMGARGNVLNPNYACEAYRYSNGNQPGTGEPNTRPTATGLTPYVIEKNLDSIRDASGTLPRFINYRIVFQNDIGSTPPVTPSVNSIAIVYRVGER